MKDWKLYSIPTCLLGVVLTMCVSAPPVLCQLTEAQRRPTGKPLPPPQLPLSHLYWHYLAYQNNLDTKAAELGAHGKDGTLMYNHLQKHLGFSDADYAPIRDSSARLTSEVKALDDQAKAIIAAGEAFSKRDQLQALSAQRQAAIDAEIIYLKQALPPEKIKAFETFLARMFSPDNAVSIPPEYRKRMASAVQQGPVNDSAEKTKSASVEQSK